MVTLPYLLFIKKEKFEYSYTIQGTKGYKV